MKQLITTIIPAYNEQDNLPTIKRRLDAVAKRLPDFDFEFLFINDGSSDDTLSVLQDLAKKDTRCCYINLSRNFGKEIGVAAGIDYARGDAVIIMDADGQEPPELIPSMVKWWQDGYDDVYAKRKNKKDTVLRKFTSKLYYRTLQKTTRIKIQIDTGDFRLFSRKAIDSLKKFHESSRQNKALFSWIGFKKKEILYEHQDRIAGRTKWKLGLFSPGNSLVNLAIDGFTSFTILPLRIISFIGALIFVSAFIYIAVILIQYCMGVPRIGGYNTLLIITLFLGSIQMISIGVIGEYIGRIFNETKGRPLYLIQDIHQPERKNSVKHNSKK